MALGKKKDKEVEQEATEVIDASAEGKADLSEISTRHFFKAFRSIRFILTGRYPRSFSLLTR